MAGFVTKTKYSILYYMSRGYDVRMWARGAYVAYNSCVTWMLMMIKNISVHSARNKEEGETKRHPTRILRRCYKEVVWFVHMRNWIGDD